MDTTTSVQSLGTETQKKVRPDFVRASLMLGKRDENGAGPFRWATPKGKELVHEDGTLFEGSPGNYLIYGLSGLDQPLTAEEIAALKKVGYTDLFSLRPREVLEGAILIDVVLSPRAPGGLYDFVAFGEIPSALALMGVNSVKELPVARVVESSSQELSTEERKERSARAQQVKLMTLAAEGNMVAQAKLATGQGRGRYQPSSEEAKSDLDWVNLAKGLE